MSMDHRPHGRLTELDESECRELLLRHSVGRIAWCGRTGPRLVPVNFVEHGGRLWVRTAAYSQLARECRDARVVLEVDDIDAFTHSGTSVVVRGTVRHEDAAQLRSDGVELESWLEGQRSLLLGIAIEEVSGRRLLPS